MPMTKKLRQALQQAQLEIDLNSDASVLSGGQQQRVALANVFLTQANVLLLDEPTSALDKNTAFTVIKNLADFAKTHDKVFIMITHDSELAKLADSTLILNRNAQQ